MTPLPIHFSRAARPTKPGTYLVRLTPQGDPLVATVTQGARRKLWVTCSACNNTHLEDIHEAALWSAPLEWVNEVGEGPGLKWFAFPVDLVREQDERVLESGTVYARADHATKACQMVLDHVRTTWEEAYGDDYRIDAALPIVHEDTEPRFNRPETVFSEGS